MDAEMQSTLIIVWLAGVVCGTAFFTGLATLVWNWWKKHPERLIFSVLAMLIGLGGMAYSITTILRLVRTWMVA